MDPASVTQKTFVYKDVSVAIKEWPFFGTTVARIQATSINEADAVFCGNYPDYLHKGRLKTEITVSIEP